MARSVEQLIDDVLRREGGFVDHPADRGGPTRYGITQATLSHHLGRSATVAEVRHLSKDVARDIYRRDYFEQPRLGLLPARIQPVLFDAAVNHGPPQALRFLQRVCNDAGFGPLDEDGIAGVRTRAAAMAADRVMGDWLAAALAEERRDFYHRLVADDASQQVFLAGWLNRLAQFEIPLEHLEKERRMSLFAALTGLFRPAKELIEVFTPNAEAEAERSHAERLALSGQDLAALQQFATEFQARARRTWWDSLVDGLNRLPRPLITLGILAFFVLAPLDPVRFLQIARAYELMPDGFWALLGVIVAFYFGGRMQLKRQDMAVKGQAIAAAHTLLAERAPARPPAPPRPEAADLEPVRPAAVRTVSHRRPNRIIAAWQQRSLTGTTS